MTIQKSCLLLALCAALASPASVLCEAAVQGPIELIVPEQEFRSPAIPGAPSLLQPGFAEGSEER